MSTGEPGTPGNGGGDIVVRQPDLHGQQLLPALLNDIFGEESNAVLCNFDGDNAQQWRLESIARSPDLLDADSVLGQVFEVKYFYAHQVLISGQTPGEVIQAVRCVLISPEDKGVAFVSAGIASDLSRIVMRFGLKPYVPALRIKIVRSKTRLGRQVYSIVPA